jgi:DNA-binding LytR/AlgR family response regulator
VRSIKDKFLVIDERRKKKILIAEIIFIEAFVNYSVIDLPNNHKITVSQHLKLLVSLLPEEFIRPHRKYLINQAFIKNIDLATMQIEMKNKLSFPIARRRRNIFR